jgi:Protein of unknown function (DUF2281)
MTVDAEIIQTLVKMPEPLKTELLHYAHYLIEKYSKNVSQLQSCQKKTSSRYTKTYFCFTITE